MTLPAEQPLPPAVQAIMDKIDSLPENERELDEEDE